MGNTKKSLTKSLLFVVVQFACLGLIVLSGPIFPANPALLGMELLGLGLGAWAILTMRIGHFNIAPDPLSWSKLVTIGPYELIRHPMYLSLLLTTLPLIINSFSFLRLFLWLGLLINLVLKLNYEEGLLIDSLDGYAEYTEKSFRLIPFIY
jgi:protein-S-isoprenylcysteine O-methyltransferase Ste14